MRVSTEIDSVRHRVGGQERAIELIAKAGFDGWDFTMIAMAWYNPRTGKIDDSHPLCGSGRLAYARKLRQIGEDNGIVCNQSHAPYPCCYKEVADSYRFALECTAEAGASICVMHPDSYKSAEENAELFIKLLPFARACGVKMALENMCTWNEKANCFFPKAACSTAEDFAKHLRLIDDEYAVACLDVGHANLQRLGSSPYAMIKALGDKIQALHLHNNDGLHDSHLLPFDGTVDYAALIKALKEAGYTGWATLETGYIFGCSGEEQVKAALSKMQKIARQIADDFERA